MFIKYNNSFEIHQTIIIAYSLINLDLCSKEFCILINKIFLDYDIKRNPLTELLTFQAIYIITKRSEFGKENLIKFVNYYKKLIDLNKVKHKQAFALIKLFNTKMKITNDPEIKTYLNDTIKMIKNTFVENIK